MSELSLGPSESATVVLDIGPKVGALIVYAPSSLEGVEIEISPIRQPASRIHSAVRERRLPTGSTYAIVYPHLPIGDHLLWDHDGSPHGPVSIVAGCVTETTWSALMEPTAPTSRLQETR